jgi:hypothetical protein
LTEQNAAAKGELAAAARGKQSAVDRAAAAEAQVEPALKVPRRQSWRRVSRRNACTQADR